MDNCHGMWFSLSFLIGFIIHTINVNGWVVALSFIKAGGGLPEATNSLMGCFTSTDKLCLISNGMCGGLRRGVASRAFTLEFGSNMGACHI